MFPVINVRHAGTPWEQGRVYGNQARERIVHSLHTYARLFADCGVDWREATRRALAYRDAIATVDCALLEEIEGVASGAGLASGDVLALNCRTEILPSSFLSAVSEDAPGAIARHAAGGIPDWSAEDWGECTAIAVSSSVSLDGHTWLAQNWDWIGRQRAALVILLGRDRAGLHFATLTEAGMLAKIGLNHHGLAVGLNILRSVGDGSRIGVPVHLILRHALSCEGVDALRERLLALAPSPGFGAASNIPAADAQGVVASFELAPAGVAALPPEDGVVIHTNHFLSPTLSAQQAPMLASLSTEARLRCARRFAHSGPISGASLETLLRDESDGLVSVCRRPDPAMSASSRVESVAGVRIDCNARRWWIAAGLPSLCSFDEVTTGLHAPVPAFAGAGEDAAPLHRQGATECPREGA
jgi:isopenicillin-N N-acyltransferase-like protein